MRVVSTTWGLDLEICSGPGLSRASGAMQTMATAFFGSANRAAWILRSCQNQSRVGESRRYRRQCRERGQRREVTVSRRRRYL